MLNVTTRTKLLCKALRMVLMHLLAGYVIIKKLKLHLILCTIQEDAYHVLSVLRFDISQSMYLSERSPGGT